MAEHVFISYYHGEGYFAELLKGKINESGIITWMDQRINVGDDWRAEIDQAIRNSSALVLIMTPEAKASEYVTYEWAFALGAGIRVIPLLLKDTELHPRLETLHHLDFTNPKMPPWSDFIKALSEKTTHGTRSDLESVNGNVQPCTIKIPDNVPTTFKNAVLKIDSTDEGERRKAIEYIGQYKHPASCEVLLSALIEHPLNDVKQWASWFLGDYRDANTISRLIEALKDKNENVRSASARALGYIQEDSD